MCDGRRLRPRGVNLIGMRRQKLKPEVRTAIKEAYRLLYRTEMNVSQALEAIERDIHPFDEVKEIVEFYRTTKRGVSSRNADDDDDYGDDS
jgi:UDP-N-acetylglucosamine acyltransferase